MGKDRSVLISDSLRSDLFTAASIELGARLGESGALLGKAAGSKPAGAWRSPPCPAGAPTSLEHGPCAAFGRVCLGFPLGRALLEPDTG